MFSSAMLKEFNEEFYVSQRLTRYDPSDPLSSVFYPVSASITEDCSSYKEHLVSSLQKDDAMVDNGQLDYEPEHEVPSDYLICGQSFAEEGNPSLHPKTIPPGGCLYGTLAIDQYNVQSWSQPVLIPNFARLDLVNHVINLCPKLYNAHDCVKIQERMAINLTEYERLILNSPHLAFSVETIKIPKQVYSLLPLSKTRGTVGVVIDYALHKANDLMEVPVRFSISDNAASMFIDFKFDFTEVKCDGNETTKKFIIGFSPIPDDVLSFWKNLPHLYSNHADRSIQIMTKYLKEVLDCDMHFNVFDIGALAIVAGCKLDNYDLGALSIVTLGKFFPDHIENMDNVLGVLNHPKHLISYKNWKVCKLTFIYNVIFGHTLRTFWPDPDIVLSSFNMNQTQFICWFSSLIGKALVGASLDINHEKMSRIQMIRGMNPDSELLNALAELWIEVPVLGFGGARFLHSTRKKFIAQFYVVRAIVVGKKMGSFTKKSPMVTMDICLKETELLYGRVYANDDSGSPSAPGYHGLQSNPQYSWDLFDLNPILDDVHSLQSISDDRPIIPLLEEWGRLNVAKVKILLGKLQGSSDEELFEFWTEKVRLYTRLRNLYENVRMEPVYVESLEFLLTATKENTLQELEGHEAQLKLKLQEKRVNLLKVVTSPDIPLNSGLHQVVYEHLPGDNTIRNQARKKKRMDNRKAAAAMKGVAVSSRTTEQRKRRFNLLTGRAQLANRAHIPGVKVSKPITTFPLPSSSTSTQSNSSKSVSYATDVKGFDGPKNGGFKKKRRGKGKKNAKVAAKKLLIGDLRHKLQ